MAHTAQHIVDEIVAASEENKSATESIKAAFNAFVTAVEANKTDPAQLQAILDAVKADTAAESEIAAGIVANTPAAPTE